MGTQSRRILVIEDEDAIRALLFTVFRRRGFQVDTAQNGAEALELCGRCRYTVILLDIMMPRMNGVQFLQEMAQRSPADRPLIITLSAAPMPHHLDPALVAGTLRKPFDIELLVDMVTSCVNAVPGQEQLEDCPPAHSESARRIHDPREPD